MKSSVQNRTDQFISQGYAVVKRDLDHVAAEHYEVWCARQKKPCIIARVKGKHALISIETFGFARPIAPRGPVRDAYEDLLRAFGYIPEKGSIGRTIDRLSFDKVDAFCIEMVRVANMAVEQEVSERSDVRCVEPTRLMVADLTQPALASVVGLKALYSL